MKKILVVAGGALVAVVLAVLLYAAWLLHSMDTPQFKAAVLARTRAALGAEVRVTRMKVSLFSGLTLEGVTIANPPPFQGDLLSAGSFTLRYRLWPLLSGRLEVQKAAFVKPQLNVLMDARGRFNYEGLGAVPVGGRAPVSSPSGGAFAGKLPVDLDLRSVTVENGSILLRDASRTLLMRADAVGLDSRFVLTSSGLAGSGKARVDRLELGGVPLVQDVSSPLKTLRDSLELAPIRGTVAGGTLSGTATINLKDFRYASSLKLEGTDVAKLLAQARSSRLVSGTLRANASFSGTGGLAVMKGGGHAEVAHCRVTNSRVLLLLSRVLQVPELANPDLDQCLAEFTLGGNHLNTTVLRLIGRQLQLTGSGSLNLGTGALDYHMKLALAQQVLNKVTIRPLRAAFTDRGDGFSTVDFTVTGTADVPHTDLAERVGRAAAVDALQGLGRLLTKHKQ